MKLFRDSIIKSNWGGKDLQQVFSQRGFAVGRARELQQRQSMLINLYIADMESSEVLACCERCVYLLQWKELIIIEKRYRFNE